MTSINLTEVPTDGIPTLPIILAPIKAVVPPGLRTAISLGRGYGSRISGGQQRSANPAIEPTASTWDSGGYSVSADDATYFDSGEG